MKPRTANEKAVDRLAKTVPPLTEAQHKWIRRNAVPAVAYQRGKGEHLATWCSNCGGEFSDFKHSKCPWCGAKITKREHRPNKRVSRGNYYTTLITTCGGWQVSRHVLVKHKAYKGGESCHDAVEVAQVWTNVQGEQVIYARPCAPCMLYYDKWIESAPMSIKHKGTKGYRYDIDSYSKKLCGVLPILRRNGFKGDFHDIMPDDLWRLLLTDNFAETLFKTGQYSLLALIADNGRLNRAAAMICVRHGYIVKDAYVWRDYIDNAAACGYDIRNPKYCCPADLQNAHDRMQRLKERRDAAEKLKSDEQKIRQNEPLYRDAKGKFLGILIKGRGVTIQPLQSVRDFFNEGLSMHHCVFANKYYSKEGSLILSARGKDGQRIETIEFDLQRGKVVQSRGRFNKTTKRHDYIVTLCNNNAKKILNCAQIDKQ